MANRLYIEILNSDYPIFEIPLQEDVTIQADSTFSSFAEDFPMIDRGLTVMNKLQGGLSGSVSKGTQKLKNTFDLQRWDKTNPVKITSKITFYTKTDPYLDVHLPATRIISLTILSNVKDRFIVPGMSLKDLGKVDTTGSNATIKATGKKNVLKAKTEDTINPKDFKNYSKMVSLEIPGLIYLAQAFLESVQITGSKNVTVSGYPLWISLDCQWSSFTPAVDTMFLSSAPLGVSTRLFYERASNRMAEKTKNLFGL